MPISADPDRTVEYWLASDADKPEAERPVFICRFMTRKQMDRIGELLEQAVRLGKGPDAWKAVHDAIGVGVVGWRNMMTPEGEDPGPFAVDKLRLVLTDEEIRELAGVTEFAGYWSRVRLAESDLKKSASPAPGGLANAANPAGAESAATNPA